MTINHAVQQASIFQSLDKRLVDLEQWKNGVIAQNKVAIKKQPQPNIGSDAVLISQEKLIEIRNARDDALSELDLIYRKMFYMKQNMTCLANTQAPSIIASWFNPNNNEPLRGESK